MIDPSENSGYIMGVRFKPLGLAKISGINMVHLTNKIIDAEEVWGKKLKWLCEAMQESKKIDEVILLLEGFLKNERQKVRLNYYIDNVTHAISLMEAKKGIISCETLQNLTYTSKKTLERAFVNFHRMMPKTYIRIIRFNVARQIMERGLEISLTQLAIVWGILINLILLEILNNFQDKRLPDIFKLLIKNSSKEPFR